MGEFERCYKSYERDLGNFLFKNPRDLGIHMNKVLGFMGGDIFENIRETLGTNSFSV